jgi:phosphoenolpyruvate carboxykinase (GTP)
MPTPLEKWVEEQAALTKPKKIHWCDGSEEETRKIVEAGIREENIEGTPVFKELNQTNWPLSYYHKSHPTDVARTEHLTFISHPDKEKVGPNNNWMSPEEAKERMKKLFDGCMKGRTMYVLPYMMGHPDSPYAKACVQITDISYVAVSMRIMTRMSKKVIEKIGNSENFVKGLHSVGDFSPDRRFIIHYPEENLVHSIGSGYGGNALLGKKCFSLRIASWLGYKEGWLAEHMALIGVQTPDNKIYYIAAAFPSACGKTNFAMLQSTLPGYKVWTIGDDIAWLNIGPDGRLWAVNPETGFFGVAPGTSMKTNPNMMNTLKNKNFYPTLYTNTAFNPDTNEPWWEGLDGAVPENLIDWQGKKWDKNSGTKAAHPNSRFTVSIYNCPTLSSEFDNPKGVPISAIIFGGKRTKLLPLIVESFNWEHGVFNGARSGSETTAAASHTVGTIRRDPMAMLPFCGYNMGDYFGHWLSIGKKLKNPPKIFTANWFIADENGKFLWPGFGDNIRVLKWIIERIEGNAKAKETEIGFVPEYNSFDLSDLNITQNDWEKIFRIDKDGWKNETDEIEKFFSQFGKHIPKEINEQLEKLKKSL